MDSDESDHESDGMEFAFKDDLCDDAGPSGFVAFMGPATSRLLLLTDAGHEAVHVIDVAGRVHVGYVAAPGTITGPRGVAARGSLVAVSVWEGCGCYFGDHVVQLFAGSGARWTAVRVVAGGFGYPGRADGELHEPYGLRFTGDGTGLVVADSVNKRVSTFRVEDGSFVRHVATGLSGDPFDVEECEGGWLVPCWGSGAIEYVGGGVSSASARLGRHGGGDGEFSGPSALALVPALGLLVVRELNNSGRVQFFATPDAVAQASMSAARVGWMVGVARGVAYRSLSSRVVCGPGDGVVDLCYGTRKRAGTSAGDSTGSNVGGLFNHCCEWGCRICRSPLLGCV
jgi:hypothetical protein